MRRVVLIMILGLNLSGCATSGRWERADSDSRPKGDAKAEARALAQDRASCLAMAYSAVQPQQQVYNSAPLFGSQPNADSFNRDYANTRNQYAVQNAENARNEIIHGCMVGKGWVWVEDPEENHRNARRRIGSE